MQRLPVAMLCVLDCKVVLLYPVPAAFMRTVFTMAAYFACVPSSFIQGSMLGDQRHGQGTHTTSTGDVYTGDWQYDQRHGQGTFKAASGMVYEGSWREDKATG